jgi:5-oxoprolinase (ATP-hydrolysing)
MYRRSDLAAGQRVEGPALVLDVGDTVVIDAGWTAKVHATGDLVATRRAPAAPRASAAVAELFAARLESIALGMGHVLERTALSPNIRDRLDFSCAIVDHAGNLIQNAPHLPVHLGALGACVRGVASALELADGDIAVTNHPAFGGSHLPDVTCVAPVFVDGARVAFVAVRAHHAEIGGTRPGSFPPDATSLAEEGVVLAPFHAVRGGAFDAATARARFAEGRYPSRNPDENLADLSAQIAAARHGVRGVESLVRELGAGRFAQLCAGELVRAERALRSRLARLEPEAPRVAVRELDDGSRVAVRLVRTDRDGAPELLVDFAGSSPVHPRNFNAPRAVTQAALLYALRLFVDEPVPMNEGLLRAVELVLPEGMLNPPFTEDPARCPPVVAGNVETSQSVVAVLVEALGLAAESQSTMNNVLFGDATFGVYETLGGGAGAGLVDGRPTAGASAVHVHMSNTRLTDIDVLERRAPVVIRRFSIRRDSGGDGEARGGDGLVRCYEFRTPVSLSVFASRRRTPPRGAEGGLDGQVGRQTIQRDRDSRPEEHPQGVFAAELGPGGQLTIETPGAGGWGAPPVVPPVVPPVRPTA